MHGKTSPILHDQKTIFAELRNPFQATRYHSLLVERSTLPEVLEVSRMDRGGRNHGPAAQTLPVERVQFHPESILTEPGMKLLANWLRSIPGEAA